MDFFGRFFWAFFLGEKGGKNPPKNPRQNPNRNLGVSRPKSTLQGSGLENLEPEADISLNTVLTHTRKQKNSLSRGALRSETGGSFEGGGGKSQKESEPHSWLAGFPGEEICYSKGALRYLNPTLCLLLARRVGGRLYYCESIPSKHSPSSGASEGSPHGGANLKVKKAHFAA